MKDPKRLRDEFGDSTGLARQILSEDASLRAPSGAKEAVWSAMFAQLPLMPDAASDAAIGTSAAQQVAATSAVAAPVVAVKGAVIGSITLVKSAALGALLGAAVLTPVVVHQAGHRPTDLSSNSAAPSIIASSNRPIPIFVATPETSQPASTSQPDLPAISRDQPGTVKGAPLPSSLPEGEPSTASLQPPSGAAPGPVASTASSSRQVSTLYEESVLVGQARRSLQNGDVATTGRLLQELQQRFPAGGLLQEREALAIEVLYRTHQRAQAKQRAEAFVRAYPTSPHSSRLREFTSP